MNKNDILFENDDYVAIDKPSGFLSIPDREGVEPSVKSVLRQWYGNIFTVHRLDRDTSGLIVFAKNEAAHRYLSMIFEERDVDKIYLGIVKGSPPGIKGAIEEPIMEHPTRPNVMVINKHGKPSLTEYEVLEDFGIYSLVQFRIYTGRTHQIRVHMQSIGHPIVCDEVYGDGKPVYVSSFKPNYKLSKDEEERPILSRLALHSQMLHFQNDQEEYYVLEAPLANDMHALMQQLRKWQR